MSAKSVSMARFYRKSRSRKFNLKKSKLIRPRKRKATPSNIVMVAKRLRRMESTIETKSGAIQVADGTEY